MPEIPQLLTEDDRAELLARELRKLQARLFELELSGSSNGAGATEAGKQITEINRRIDELTDRYPDLIRRIEAVLTDGSKHGDVRDETA